MKKLKEVMKIIKHKSIHMNGREINEVTDSQRFLTKAEIKLMDIVG